jgi:hypothetical protein
MLRRTEEADQMIRSHNCEIREYAQEVQNVDKGFAHYLKYFRDDREVRAPIQVEAGKFGEVG